MVNKAACAVRRTLLWLIGNEALFLFFAFLFTSSSVLRMDPLLWYQDSITTFATYFILPWGMALSLLRLERSVRVNQSKARADIAVLFVLLAWLIVPFAIRFGFRLANIYCWANHIVVFFGVYALVTDADKRHLQSVIDLTSALFAALSFVLGVMALYCVLTVHNLGEEPVSTLANGYVFGLVGDDFFTIGLHYNDTGMFAVCCALLSLVGFFRRRNPIARLMHLIPSLMMMLIVVLCQSRTSRYALLGALAVGCYGMAADRLPIRRGVARHAVAMACALIVLVGGYFISDFTTDAALGHYARVRASRLAQIAPDPSPMPDSAPEAPAQDSAAVEPTVETTLDTAVEAADSTAPVRPAIDSTFSDRTIIWSNLFDFWRENPKYLVIGNGMHRTGSLLVKNTMNTVDAIAVHNMYLQFLADYGIIGFVLLIAFFALIVPPALRVFFARRPKSQPGDRVFVMIVVALLLTGMMESQPLAPFSAPNLALFFSLAVLYSLGSEPERPTPGVTPLSSAHTL